MFSSVVSILAQAAPVSSGAGGLANPIGFVESAASAVPGIEAGTSGPISIVLLLTLLTIAPSILILCTSFTRFVVVLGLLRQAIGTQVIVGLSVLLTFVAMGPTLEAMWDGGLKPYLDAPQAERDSMAAWEGMKAPLRTFMVGQIRHAGNESSVRMMMEFGGWDPEVDGDLDIERDPGMMQLVPAYVLSELKVAFLIAFRIYLPFLVIDMVVSSLLISMGMMMLPPVFVSLPFKLLLFVIADGWMLVAGSLLHGVAAAGGG
jgi:flagellar biosynthetic protein FliP